MTSQPILNRLNLSSPETEWRSKGPEGDEQLVLGLKAEQELVIRCVRRAFGQDDVGAPVGAEFKWEAFAELALEQGLGPLVHQGLSLLDLAAPDDIRARLRGSHAMSLVLTQAVLEPNMRRVLDVLGGGNIEPIVLKGGALAYQAYPRPHHRTLSDIDLLVRDDQLMAADEALRSNGYTVLDLDLGHGHQHLPPYISPDSGFSIELHHHVVPEANPYSLDLDGFWARSQSAVLAGVPARVLSPTDTLLHVCVHLSFGHRYQWYSLRTLTDILALTSARHGAFDWDELMNAVRQSRTAGAVYWLLRLSQLLLGAPVPDGVLKQLAPPQPLRRVLEVVLDSPYVINGEAPGQQDSDVLYNLVRELSLYGGCSVREQISAVWGCLFPSPDGITHLPKEMTDSRMRYVAYLSGPGRITRGMVAVARLLARLPQAA